jgi:amidase
VHNAFISEARIPVVGVVPLARSFDTVGWFARDATMLRRVGEVLLGIGHPRTPSRLVIADDAFALAGAGSIPAMVSALGSGIAVEHAAVAPDGLEVWANAFRMLQGWEACCCALRQQCAMIA